MVLLYLVKISFSIWNKKIGNEFSLHPLYSDQSYTFNRFQENFPAILLLGTVVYYVTYFFIWSVDFEDHEDQNPKKNESKAPTLLYTTFGFCVAFTKFVLCDIHYKKYLFELSAWTDVSLLKRQNKLIDTVSTQFLLALTQNLHIITYLQYNFPREHYNPRGISPATKRIGK